MVTIDVNVETKEIGESSLYQPPEKLFETFEKKINEILNSLSEKKVSNRAIKLLMEREGRRKLKRLRKFLTKRNFSIKEKKIIYDAFFRIFKKLQWAKDAGSEKEIELKIWITSSLDFLDEVIKTLEERK